MYVMLIVVCPFVLFLLAIVLSVLLRYTDSNCHFGIFKLFLSYHGNLGFDNWACQNFISLRILKRTCEIYHFSFGILNEFINNNSCKVDGIWIDIWTDVFNATSTRWDNKCDRKSISYNGTPTITNKLLLMMGLLLCTRGGIVSCL
jgi:hypothetical protein